MINYSFIELEAYVHASVVCFNIHRKIHEKELREQPTLSNHNNNKVKIVITNNIPVLHLLLGKIYHKE
jgi:hypothetical protein